MFIETTTYTYKKDETTSIINLAFAKSLKVQAFPCSRRRSPSQIAYSIPFDPEARLNTEANIRKYSALNGFTQNYLNAFDSELNQLAFSLAGYLFTVDLSGSDLSKFGSNLSDKVNPDAESLYANILIENTPLFSGDVTYYTGILQNIVNLSSSDIKDESALDLLCSSQGANYSNKNDYYFSGLAFSSEPLTGKTGTSSVSFIKVEDTGLLKQTIVSLQILEKTNNDWVLYKPALLPKIEHGNTDDSVKVIDLYAKDIIAEMIYANIDAKSIKAESITVTDTAKIEKLDIDNFTANESISSPIANINELIIDDAADKIGSLIVKKGNDPHSTKVTYNQINSYELLQNGNPVPTIWLRAINDDTYKLHIQLGTIENMTDTTPLAPDKTIQGWGIIDGGTVGGDGKIMDNTVSD